MTVRIRALVVTVLLMLAMPMAAEARALALDEAKAVALKKAQKVKRDLASDGAKRAWVPGCWRRTTSRVSCYFSVRGYDRELDFRWKCMLRVTVTLRRSGAYGVRYGQAACG